MNAKPLWIYKGSLQQQFQLHRRSRRKIFHPALSDRLNQPCFSLPFTSMAFSWLASSREATWLSRTMPQRYFIPTLLNPLRRAQAATARWIKLGTEAGTTPALDPTVTVSIPPAALTPQPWAAAPPGPAPGAGAEPRPEPRIPRQRPGPPPERGAPGNRRLREAGPRGNAAGSGPGSASPGGPRASRSPTPVLGSPVGPALSGRLLPEGGSSRNAGFYGIYPAGKWDKEKGERGISRALAFLTQLPLRAGEVSGLLFKCNKNSDFLFLLFSFISCCSTCPLNTSSKSKQIISQFT